MTRGPDKRFDRDEALKRAMELFWYQGFEGTSLNQLLEHMGIGRQSLYDTFRDKKSLFLEALGLYFRQRIELMTRVLRRPGSPLGNLEEWFESLPRQADESKPCGCFIGNSLAELGFTDPEMGRILRGYLERMESCFMEVLREAKRAGEISSDAPIKDLAKMLVVTTHGIALLSKVQPGRELMDRLLPRTLAMLKAS
jgi:TetR/AcrR family transcriptional repressor of nem operon